MRSTEKKHPAKRKKTEKKRTGDVVEALDSHTEMRSQTKAKLSNTKWPNESVCEKKRL